MEQVIKKFSELPLGTRFNYQGEDTENQYVILDHYDCGRVAKWEGVDSPVLFQGIFSAAETEELCKQLEVIVIA